MPRERRHKRPPKERGAALSVEVRQALLEWMRDGVLPEPFLAAVLANDLMEAVARSTPGEFEQLPQLVALLRSMPRRCYGSRVNLAEWLHSGGVNGRVRIRAEAERSGLAVKG